MKGRRVHYSEEELAWLKDHREMPRKHLHRFFCEAFGRDDVSEGHIKALCTRKGWTTGRTGRFGKGQAPRNKGKTCPPGTGGRHPNARNSQFKAGQRPHTYRGPGHESIDSKDGYVWLIVAEPNPYTGAKTRRVQKHRWLWEKANGPVPEGHVLKCLDGDKTNTDPTNWEAIPRGMLPRLAGSRWYKPYDDYEPELRPTVLNIARLEHMARTTGKERE